MLCNIFVITSYSIHYTKLYETATGRASAGRALAAAAMAVLLSAAMFLMLDRLFPFPVERLSYNFV